MKLTKGERETFLELKAIASWIVDMTETCPNCGSEDWHFIERPRYEGDWAECNSCKAVWPIEGRENDNDEQRYTQNLDSKKAG